MSRWPRGEAELEQLITAKQVQQVMGGQANGAHLLEKASRTLGTAGDIADQDPDSAYVLAYDAARYGRHRDPCPTGPAPNHIGRALRG